MPATVRESESQAAVSNPVTSLKHTSTNSVVSTDADFSSAREDRLEPTTAETFSQQLVTTNSTSETTSPGVAPSAEPLATPVEQCRTLI